ncbi:MAG: hypothetical protein AAF957_09140 [Planctomycetota bacterium]
MLTSARNIPAYAKVRNDDVFDAQRKRISSIDIPEGLAEKNGILTDASMIFGRVLAKAKRPGFAFTEEDFLPEGTRPGLAGGVPPGKRGYRVEVDLVHGIIGLNPGDRFDLITSRTVEDVPRKENTPAFVGVYAEMMGQRAKSSRGVDRAQVDVIVQNGIVVTPVETRLVPIHTAASLTSGPKTTTRPVQEMVIALDPEEVAPLVAALQLDSGVTCVARSGRPGDPESDLTPSYASPKRTEEPEGAPEEMHVIEVIEGGNRALVPVPHRAAADDEPEAESTGNQPNDG